MDKGKINFQRESAKIKNKNNLQNFEKKKLISTIQLI